MSENFYIKLRYRGRLTNPTEVQQLILETEDICKTNNWTYQIWDKNWTKPSTLTSTFTGHTLSFEGHAPLKGISFTIGESESVWLTFLPDGTLQSLITLTDPAFTGNDEQFPWQRVKTGFAKGKIHLLVCKLFRHLANKYFKVFEVMDESGYWKNQDDEQLINWMENVARDYQIMEEEMAALELDETLSPEVKKETLYRILKTFGDKYRLP